MRAEGAARQPEGVNKAGAAGRRRFGWSCVTDGAICLQSFLQWPLLLNITQQEAAPCVLLGGILLA